MEIPFQIFWMRTAMETEWATGSRARAIWMAIAGATGSTLIVTAMGELPSLASSSGVFMLVE